MEQAGNYINSMVGNFDRKGIKMTKENQQKQVENQNKQTENKETKKVNNTETKKPQQAKPQQNSIVLKDKQIGSYLSEFKQNILKFAVRDYNHNEFMKTAMLCISEDWKLMKCLDTDEGRASLYHSLKLGATTGLSLNPQEGKACLTAYEYKGKMVVSYQIMKNGMLQLLKETGQVKYITADSVRENDEFEVLKSMDGDTYTFKPAIKSRGDCVGYFAACKLTDGTTYVVYMSDEEMVDHEERYSPSKSLGEKSPWKKSAEGMKIKTVLKKLARSLHLSDESSAGVSADDFAEVYPQGVEDSEISVKLLDSSQKPTDVI